MFEKLYVGWCLAPGTVAGWYTKRSDLVAAILFPALAAFYVLWALSIVIVLAVGLVCMLVDALLDGIRCIGKNLKEDFEIVRDLFGMLGSMIVEVQNDKEEPEEEPEETNEELVEELVGPSIKLHEPDTKIEEYLDEYLDDSEES